MKNKILNIFVLSITVSIVLLSFSFAHPAIGQTPKQADGQSQLKNSTQSILSEEQIQQIKASIRDEVKQEFIEHIETEVTSKLSTIIDAKIADNIILRERIQKEMNSLFGIKMNWLNIQIVIVTLTITIITLIPLVLGFLIWLFRRTIRTQLVTDFKQEIDFDNLVTQFRNQTNIEINKLQELAETVRDEATSEAQRIKNSQTEMADNFQSQIKSVRDDSQKQINDIVVNFRMRILLQEGEILSKSGNYDQALKAYQNALILNSDSVEALCGKSSMEALKERYSDALTTIDHALNLEPTVYEAWFIKGEVLKGQERYDEALAALEEAHQINPNDPEISYQKARIYSLNNETDRAFQSLRQVINLNSEYKDKAKHESDFNTINSDPIFQEIINN
ncbi:MAG: tetratricopeptide repeat protein [Crocosphaera sp.]